MYVGIRSAEENTVRDEALKLIADGLERKSITVLQGLLFSSHPEQMVYEIEFIFHFALVVVFVEWEIGDA